MSTIPKEWEKNYKEWFFHKHKSFFPTPDLQIKWFKENILDQLATDGREELEKENHSYKISVLAGLRREGYLNDQITALQSQCTEKEMRIEELKKALDERLEFFKKHINQRDKSIEELKAENERLKEQYGIMDGRRERAIKSLEESEKQFGEQQEQYRNLEEAYNKLLNQ